MDICERYRMLICRGHQAVRMVAGVGLVLWHLLAVNVGHAAEHVLEFEVAGDAFTRIGLQNTNEGGAQQLRVQRAGANLTFVRIDDSAVAAVSDAEENGGILISATLEVSILSNGGNWGHDGDEVSLHRLTQEWVEGNGRVSDHPWYLFWIPPFRGNGNGITWNCSIDAEISNHHLDCAGDQAWNLGKTLPHHPGIFGKLNPWLPDAAATITVTNQTSGVLQFDITSELLDFASGSDNFGWVIRSDKFPGSGWLQLGSRESEFAPRVIVRIDRNDPPEIGGTPSTAAYEDADYQFVPQAIDPDGDLLTFSVENLPPWANFDLSTGAIWGTPTNQDVGAYGDIVISVADPFNPPVMLPAFSIEVINVNDPPTITGVPPISVVQGSEYTFAPQVDDDDLIHGDFLTVGVINVPAWLDWDPSTGLLSGTPGNEDVGTHVGIVTYVEDSVGATVALPPFSITVLDLNIAPTIFGAPPAALEDEEYVFVPMVADEDLIHGELLFFEAYNLPLWMQFDELSGEISGTPSNADVGIAEAISIVVTDSSGNQATLGPLSLEVVNSNDGPQISGAPPEETTEDAPYAFTPVANDDDVIHGDTLSYSITNAPPWAEFDVTTGTLSGTPGNGDVGRYGGIVISVSDSAGASASLGPFSIIVLNDEDFPIISGQPLDGIDEDVSYSFTPTTTDDDLIHGDVLTFYIVNRPGWAGFNDQTGRLSGTPRNAHVGTYAGVSISVVDSAGAIATLAPFSIVVRNVNDAPQISGSPAAEVDEDAEYVFSPAAADDDLIHGDQLMFSVENLPSWLTYEQESGELRGTPGNDDVGSYDGIVVQVADVAGAQAILPAFSIHVINTNDAPAISGVPATDIQAGDGYQFVPAATDPDLPHGDTLSYEVTNLPAWASFDQLSGEISGTPSNADAGIYENIVVAVRDAAGATAALSPFNVLVHKGAIASGEIGPLGGFIEITDAGSLLYGSRFTVPEGSLTNPVEFSIYESETPIQPLHEGNFIVSPTVRIEPAGIVFLEPATLEVPIETLSFDPGLELLVFGIMESDVAGMEAAPIQSLDQGAGMATMEISHLSEFAISVTPVDPVASSVSIVSPQIDGVNRPVRIGYPDLIEVEFRVVGQGGVSLDQAIFENPEMYEITSRFENVSDSLAVSFPTSDPFAAGADALIYQSVADDHFLLSVLASDLLAATAEGDIEIEATVHAATVFPENAHAATGALECVTPDCASIQTLPAVPLFSGAVVHLDAVNVVCVLPGLAGIEILGQNLLAPGLEAFSTEPDLVTETGPFPLNSVVFPGMSISDDRIFVDIRLFVPDPPLAVPGDQFGVRIRRFSNDYFSSDWVIGTHIDPEISCASTPIGELTFETPPTSPIGVGQTWPDFEVVVRSTVTGDSPATVSSADFEIQLVQGSGTLSRFGVPLAPGTFFTGMGGAVIDGLSYNMAGEVRFNIVPVGTISDVVAPLNGVSVTAEAGQPTSIAFDPPPAGIQGIGRPWDEFAVVALDASGFVAAGAQGCVDLTQTAGASSLSGTLTRCFIDGYARFDDVSVSQQGTLSVQVQSATLGSTSSVTIDVTPAVPVLTDMWFPCIADGYAATVFEGGHFQATGMEAFFSVDGGPEQGPFPFEEAALGMPIQFSFNRVSFPSVPVVGGSGNVTIRLRLAGDDATSTSITAFQDDPAVACAGAPAPKFVLTVPPSAEENAGVPWQPFTIAVEASTPDGAGVRVPVDFLSGESVQVAFEAVDGTGVFDDSVAGTQSLMISRQMDRGLVEFSGFSYSAAEVVELRFGSSASGVFAPSELSGVYVDVKAGPPTKLAFAAGAPSAVPVGEVWPAVEVSVVDAGGSVVPDATGCIDLQLDSGLGTLTGTLQQCLVNGVATFDDLSYDVIEQISLSASGAGFATLSPLTVSVVEPFPILESVEFPCVSDTELALDLRGQHFVSTGMEIIGSIEGQGEQPPLPINALDPYVRFSEDRVVLLQPIPGDVTLTLRLRINGNEAQASTVVATSPNIATACGSLPPAHLGFETPPDSLAIANAPWSEFGVILESADPALAGVGLLVPNGSTASVVLTSGSSSLGGTTQVSFVGGTASFAEITYDQVESIFITVSADFPGLANPPGSITGIPVDVQIGPPAALSIENPVPVLREGESWDLISVDVLDAGGNVVVGPQVCIAATVTVIPSGGADALSGAQPLCSNTGIIELAPLQYAGSGTLGIHFAMVNSDVSLDQEFYVRSVVRPPPRIDSITVQCLLVPELNPEKVPYWVVKGDGLQGRDTTQAVEVDILSMSGSQEYQRVGYSYIAGDEWRQRTMYSDTLLISPAFVVTNEGLRQLYRFYDEDPSLSVETNPVGVRWGQEVIDTCTDVENVGEFGDLVAVISRSEIQCDPSGTNLVLHGVYWERVPDAFNGAQLELQGFPESAVIPSETRTFTLASPVGITVTQTEISVPVAELPPGSNGTAILKTPNGVLGPAITYSIPDEMIGCGNGVPGQADGTFIEFAGQRFARLASPIALVTEDFNGDGILDIAAPNRAFQVYPDFQGGVFLGRGVASRGSGSFLEPLPVAAIEEAHPSVIAGDFTGDGTLDLAGLRESNPTLGTNDPAVTLMDVLFVEAGAGDGTFGAPADVMTGLNASLDLYAMAAGNFVTTNDRDEIAVLQRGGSVELLAYDGSQYSSVGTVALGTLDATYGAISAVDATGDPLDFNGDSNIDLLVSTEGTAWALLGNGAGSFSVSQTFSIGTVADDQAAQGVAVIAGLFSGDDARVDVVAHVGGTVSTFEQSIAGQFVQSSQLNLGFEINALVAGDFDDDGILDLAGAQRFNHGIVFDGQNTWLSAAVVMYGCGAVEAPTGGCAPGLGFATGQFDYANQIPWAGGRGLVTADFNGDGILDLASGYGGIFLGEKLPIPGVNPNNSAPTISGMPDAIAYVNQPEPYSFIPTASDSDVSDTLSFGIENIPSWASFDANTGELSGTPQPGDEGAYANIVITVSDGQDETALSAFSIEVLPENAVPVADAGADIAFHFLGDTLYLDGSGSFDNDLSPSPVLSYTWNIVGAPVGAVAGFDSAASANPAITPDALGLWTFELIVNDGLQDSLPDTVEVVVVENAMPVIAIDFNSVVLFGDSVQLDASATADPDSIPGPLVFTWELLSVPGGSAAVLNDVNTPVASITPDEVGIYEIRLTVSDGRDSVSELITVEAVDVAITVTAPEEGELILADSVVVTGNAFSVVDIADINFSIDGRSIFSIGSSGPSPLDFSHELTGLVEGDHALIVVATDSDGNSFFIQRNFSTDSIGPNVNITTPAEGASFPPGSVLVAGFVTDSSGIASLTVNGIAETLDVTNRFERSLSFSGDGPRTITVVATDNAGRQTTVVRNITIDAGVSDPVVQISTPANALVTDQASVLVGGGVTTQATLTSITVAGVSVPVGTGLFSRVVPLNLGSNTITVIANDSAGGSGSASIIVTRDTDAPTITISSPSDGDFILTGGPVTVSGTASDDVSVSSVEVNGQDAPLNAGTWSTQLALTEGANTITATATDGFGHTASTAIEVFLDTEPPVVEILTPETGIKIANLVPQNETEYESTEILQVTARGTDANGIDEMSIGGVVIPLNGEFAFGVFAPVPGNNIIEARGRDAAGRESIATVSIFYDPDAPTISLEALPEHTAGEEVEIRGTVIDNDLLATLVVDGVELTPGADGSFSLIVALEEGENRFEVVATDDAGNSTSVRVLVTRDSSGPKVVGIFPANGMEEVPLAAAVVVIFDEDIQPDSVGGDSVVLSSPSGRVPATVSLGESGDRITVTPVAQLELDSVYRVTVANDPLSAVHNLAGLPTVGAESAFTTEGETYFFSGQVLADDFTPIVGATVRLTGTEFTTTTDGDGVFAFQNPPPGNQHLLVDARNLDESEVGLFEVYGQKVAIDSGVSDSLGFPIVMPRMRPETASFAQAGGPSPIDFNGAFDLGDRGSFRLDTVAGSLTFPDGKRDGLMEASAVGIASLPKDVREGVTGSFIAAYDMQPSGTKIDPPAPICIPNEERLPVGTEVELHAYSHDSGILESAGIGTVIAKEFDENGEPVVTEICSAEPSISHFSMVLATAATAATTAFLAQQAYTLINRGVVIVKVVDVFGLPVEGVEVGGIGPKGFAIFEPPPAGPQPIEEEELSAEARQRFFDSGGFTNSQGVARLSADLSALEFFTGEAPQCSDSAPDGTGIVPADSIHSCTTTEIEENGVNFQLAVQGDDGSLIYVNRNVNNPINGSVFAIVPLNLGSGGQARNAPRSGGIYFNRAVSWIPTTVGTVSVTIQVDVVDVLGVARLYNPKACAEEDFNENVLQLDGLRAIEFPTDENLAEIATLETSIKSCTVTGTSDPQFMDRANLEDAGVTKATRPRYTVRLSDLSENWHSPIPRGAPVDVVAGRSLNPNYAPGDLFGPPARYSAGTPGPALGNMPLPIPFSDSGWIDEITQESLFCNSTIYLFGEKLNFSAGPREFAPEPLAVLHNRGEENSSSFCKKSKRGEDPDDDGPAGEGPKYWRLDLQEIGTAAPGAFMASGYAATSEGGRGRRAAFTVSEDGLITFSKIFVSRPLTGTQDCFAALSPNEQEKVFTQRCKDAIKDGEAGETILRQLNQVRFAPGRSLRVVVRHATSGYIGYQEVTLPDISEEPPPGGSEPPPEFPQETASLRGGRRVFFFDQSGTGNPPGSLSPREQYRSIRMWPPLLTLDGASTRAKKERRLGHGGAMRLDETDFKLESQYGPNMGFTHFCGPFAKIEELEDANGVGGSGANQVANPAPLFDPPFGWDERVLGTVGTQQERELLIRDPDRFGFCKMPPPPMGPLPPGAMPTRSFTLADYAALEREEVVPVSPADLDGSRATPGQVNMDRNADNVPDLHVPGAVQWENGNPVAIAFGPVRELVKVDEPGTELQPFFLQAWAGADGADFDYGADFQMLNKDYLPELLDRESPSPSVQNLYIHGLDSDPYYSPRFPDDRTPSMPPYRLFRIPEVAWPTEYNRANSEWNAPCKGVGPDRMRIEVFTNNDDEFEPQPHRGWDLRTQDTGDASTVNLGRVFAAKDGYIIGIDDNRRLGENQNVPGSSSPGKIWIAYDDGTAGIYVHQRPTDRIEQAWFSLPLVVASNDPDVFLMLAPVPVTAGLRVRAGEQVSISNSSGVNGAHLHYEWYPSRSESLIFGSGDDGGPSRARDDPWLKQLNLAVGREGLPTGDVPRLLARYKAAGGAWEVTEDLPVPGMGHPRRTAPASAVRTRYTAADFTAGDAIDANRFTQRGSGNNTNYPNGLPFKGANRVIFLQDQPDVNEFIGANEELPEGASPRLIDNHPAWRYPVNHWKCEEIPEE